MVAHQGCAAFWAQSLWHDPEHAAGWGIAQMWLATTMTQDVRRSRRPPSAPTSSLRPSLATTDRSATPQRVPAWMVNVAWEHLRTTGELTNAHLLADDGLNVKRSSFVCALLAALPDVRVESRRPIRLRQEGWRPGSGSRWSGLDLVSGADPDP